MHESHLNLTLSLAIGLLALHSLMVPSTAAVIFSSERPGKSGTEWNPSLPSSRKEQFRAAQTPGLRIVTLPSAGVAGDGNAVDSSLGDKVISAAQKLAEQANYTWTLTGEGSRIEPVGPIPASKPRTGGAREYAKTTRDGFTHVSLPGRPGVVGTRGPLGFGVPPIEVVIKENKFVCKHEGSGVWHSLADLEQAESGPRVIGPAVRFLRFKTPAIQVVDLAAKARELTEADGVISGELTEEDAKQVLPPSVRVSRRMPPDGSAAKVSVEFFPPEVLGKVSVKFWVQNGALTKYQYHYQGSIPFPRERGAFYRTVTIEISDVGTTDVTVPEEAKQKLSSDD